MSTISRIFIAFVSLFPATLFAETVTTPIGTLVAPDGLKVIERNDKPDPTTGKPGGLVVFSKANDLPRAVFIVSWAYVEPDSKPFDALDSAVKIGNPFDKTLTGQNATQVKVGGVDGGRYEGLLPNGLRAISYVVANGPYRIVVLLKGPVASPYKELTNEFAQAIEKFVWALPEAPNSTAPKQQSPQ